MSTEIKPLRLSAAIRLGAALHPQAFDVYCKWTVDDHGYKTSMAGTCAIGAANTAAGLMVGTELPEAEWPGLDLCAIRRCPALAPVERERQYRYGCMPVMGECAQTGDLHLVITHLNDDHRYSRERIAAWVETLESVDVLPERSDSLPERSDSLPERDASVVGAVVA